MFMLVDRLNVRSLVLIFALITTVLYKENLKTIYSTQCSSPTSLSSRNSSHVKESRCERGESNQSQFHRPAYRVRVLPILRGLYFRAYVSLQASSSALAGCAYYQRACMHSSMHIHPWRSVIGRQGTLSYVQPSISLHAKVQ